VPGVGSGGTSGFLRKVYRTGPEPMDVAVGDLDGDGLADVAAACWGGLHINFGHDPRRSVRVKLGAGHHTGCVIEDYDLDGRPEVITTSNVEPAQRFFFVSFDAERKATVRSWYGAPLFTHGLATPDLDLDGLPDLVATGSASRTLDVKFNNGSGGVRIVGSTWFLDLNKRNRRGYGLAVGHLDADSLLDIAVADGTRVVVFQGKLNLSFQPGIAIPSEKDRPRRAVDVLFADLNGDGRDELIIAQEHPLLDLPKDVIVVRNEDSKLTVSQEINAGARVQSLSSGLLNEDPHLDVVATAYLTGEVVLLHGDGKGRLGKPVRLASGRGACRVAVSDVDGDRRDDLVVANRLDDTITVLLNRRDAPTFLRRGPRRAEPCPPPTRVEFKLEGLTDPYEFAGEFRLPARVREPSGLAALGGVSSTMLVLVSDKESSLFRAVLDVAGERLLVGPAIPLLGHERARLDLEGVAWDQLSGNLFLACEAKSTVLRTVLWGTRLDDPVSTGIPFRSNDGIEALALRRKKDGTPLLYAFKERHGKSLAQPFVRVFGIEDSPFELVQRGPDLKLPLYVPDQTGATVAEDRLYVVSRGMRGIVEVAFDGDGFAKEANVASYRELTGKLLGLGTPFGAVEGIAIGPAPRRDLFLLVDNNGELLGKEGLNRGREGRLLWFVNRGSRTGRPRPARVIVKQIHVPWRGAQGAPPVNATREKAREIAEGVLERLERGEDFDQLAREFHYTDSKLPARLRIAADGFKVHSGEFKERDLPMAVANLAFNLDVGETGLCEFHREESPYGYHVLLRIE
jgi:uncharacterized protein YjiK